MMKGKKIHFFFGIFAALLLCTILSDGIQKQMTVKVQVSKSHDVAGETELIKYSTAVLDAGALYEVEKSSQWEEGLRAREVPVEFYEVRGDEVIFSPNMGMDQILYRTKSLFPGATVEKTSVYSRGEELYLLVYPDKSAELQVAQGKEPFMENLQKEELGLTSGERLYSITEVEQFFRQLPLLAILSIFLIAIALFWSYGWKMDGKMLQAIDLFLCIVIFGIYQIIRVIELPSSLLPRRMIFELAHYNKEFHIIFTALEQIGSEMSEAILKNLWHNIWIGGVIILLGVGISVFAILAKKS